MSREYSPNYGSQYDNRQQRSNINERESIRNFENGRIKTLQEELLHIHKKTFTKWMNSFLVKAKLEVKDLFVDLADGVKLLKLLEIISGEKLGQPNNGKMRVHKIENLNKSLAFLYLKVHLESIGAEDIVDGNTRIILGLIWTIILHFQIQKIEIDVDEENVSSAKRSAKDALLLWCQRKTHGYNNVNITDFSGSWRSGLGFNALIHAYRPDLFDFDSLIPGRNTENLNHAFDTANNELGISQLLDAGDIDQQRPDEKSILTYIASYYHTFARMENEQKSGEWIEEALNLDHFFEDHDNEEGWLIDKQRICKTGIIAKDLRAVLSLQQKHKDLEDEMKERKSKSCQITEVGKKLIDNKHSRLSEVQMRLDLLKDHWKALELLAELRKRQLEDAAEAYQFYTDAIEMESWLNEKMALVASDDNGVDEPSSQALLQRHRNLQGELNAYSGDISNLNQQAAKLIKAGISTLKLSAEPDQVPEPVEQEEWVNETRLVPKDIWEEVPVERLEHRSFTEQKLLPHVKASYPFDGQGMKMNKGEIMVLKSKTNSDWWSVQKLDGTEGFIPSAYVKEIEPRLVSIISTKSEKVKTITKVKKTILVRQVVPVKRLKATNITQVKHCDPEETTDSDDSVEKHQKRINQTYDNLRALAKRRHALLEDSIRLFGFYRGCDDFEKWIKDKEKLLETDDESDVETAKQKFEKFLTDLSASSKQVEALDMAVEDFTRQGHSQLDKIKVRQKQIHQLWDHLNYNHNNEDAKLNLDELINGEVENNLRSCKELINTHNVLVADTALGERKVGVLVSSGEDMAQEGHADRRNAERFNQCEESANNLINSEINYEADIEKHQEQLGVKFAGEDFVRFTGHTRKHMLNTTICVVHLLAELTKSILLQQEYDKKMEEFKYQMKDTILEKYSGEEHLQVPPKTFAQTGNSTENSRSGKIIKGQESIANL